MSYCCIPLESLAMFSTPVRLVSRTGVVSLQLLRSALPTLTTSPAVPSPSSSLSTSAPSLQSDPAMSKATARHYAMQSLTLKMVLVCF